MRHNRNLVLDQGLVDRREESGRICRLKPKIFLKYKNFWHQWEQVW